MISLKSLENEIMRNRCAIESHSGKVDQNNVQVDLLTKTIIVALKELSALRKDINFLCELIGKMRC